LNTNYSIRMASEADAPQIREIYSPYVMDTAITFEYEVPTVIELSKRIRDTLQAYPSISWDMESQTD